MNFRQRKQKLPAALLLLPALIGILLIVLGFILSGKGESGGQKDREKALAAFLECGEGVGKASVTLCYSEDGARVVGAAVVCAGGDDPTVCARVTRLLSAALGIGANRIYVTSSA